MNPSPKSPIAFLLLAAFLWPMASSLAAEIKPEYQEAFDWLDKRGFPDLSEKQLVRIKFQWSTQKPQYHVGFLLAETPDSFRVMDLDLNEVDHKRASPGTNSFKPIGLVEFAQQQLAPKDPDQEDGFARFGRRVSEGVELFYLARICASRGHTDLANELVAKAKQALNQRRKEKLGLIDALAKDISHAKTWKAFVRFGNAEVSRKELLSEFHEIFRFYPQNKHRKRVQDTIAMLERMVREDEARAKSPIQNPNRQQQIAELIFRLRDQNGQQWMQPGACDIFSGDRFAKAIDSDPKERSPAWQLREIGSDAVPQLIEVLEDRTFTRSVGYHRNFYFSHHVLRVGDCAERIIGGIAGRPFYQRKHTNGAMQKDGAAATVKEQIEQWWAEIDGKGEERVLIEAVVRGDDKTSAAQAQRLAERYPNAALAAITQGLKNAQSDWTRTNLIQATKKLQTPAVLDLLAAQMNGAPDLLSRVTAAEELLERKNEPKLVVETMMRQWTDYRKKGVKLTELQRIVWLFKKADSPQAIDLVANDFANLPESLRLDTVSDLGELLEEEDPSGPWHGSRASCSDKTLARIESLLVNATKDTEKRMGISGSRNDMTYQNPRICDFAGYFLSNRDEYTFDMTTSQARRDLALAKIRNAYRAKQNLPPMKLPVIEMNPGLPKETSERLIKKLTGAADKSALQQIAKKTQEFGINALPSMLKAWQTLKPKGEEEREVASDSVAGHVRQMHLNLANKINKRIVLPEQHAVAAKGILQRIDQLNGRALMRCMIDLMKNLPEGFNGFTLTASRDDTMTGVTVRVNYENGKDPNQSASDGWTNNKLVTVGSEGLYGSSGSSSVDHPLNLDSHDDLIRSIDKAAKADADQNVTIEIRQLRVR